MIYIFDIDGTLADITHRLHFIQQKPADWRAFYAACPDDLPIPAVIEVARSLTRRHHTIVIATGRSDEIQQKTHGWLRDHDIFFDYLLMRKSGDHREDTIVKEELLDDLLKTHQIEDIAGVFEDRQQVVDMYRQRGLRVFQVADGDF